MLCLCTDFIPLLNSSYVCFLYSKKQYLFIYLLYIIFILFDFKGGVWVWNDKHC